MKQICFYAKGIKVEMIILQGKPHLYRSSITAWPFHFSLPIYLSFIAYKSKIRSMYSIFMKRPNVLKSNIGLNDRET